LLVGALVFVILLKVYTLFHPPTDPIPGPIFTCHDIGITYEYRRQRPIIGDALLWPAELLVVGDSRVQTGLRVKGLEEAFGYNTKFYASAANYGGQIADYTESLLETRPRKMILTLAPFGVYVIQREVKFDENRWILFRTVVDNTLEMAVNRTRSYITDPIVFTTRLQAFEIPRMTRFFSPFSFESYAYPVKYEEKKNIRLYNEFFIPGKDIREKNMQTLTKNVEKLLEKGWEIVCIRIPVGESLRKIEEENFDCGRFDKMCKDLDIKYLDYSREHFETFDASHLGPFEAERFTRRLVKDLKEITDW